MELIRSFSQIGKADAAIAGGKGASLGEMTQAGIPVPPGFVILTNAFERFLDEVNLNQELDTIFHTVNHEEIRTVDRASEQIQALIIAATMPEDIAAEILVEFTRLNAQFVAVRSSATAEDGSNAAWAGQLDTFLNTTEEKLIENVQKCWASLFTSRAIFYRFEKGMRGSKISVAVVIQKMVQSEVSGIAFSVHPVTEDYNQLIIEAGFGLGEAIVSGQVTPDSFVVEKEPRRIVDKNVSYQSRALWRAENGGNEWRELSQEEGNKPALSDEQVMELSEMVLHIEAHYGFPCDIEWAFEAGSFFITQSRPITTLTAKAPHQALPEIFSDPSKWQYVGLYKSELFYLWLWRAWHVADLAQKAGLEIDYAGYIGYDGGHSSLYIPTQEYLHDFFRTKIETEGIEYFEGLVASANEVFAAAIQYGNALSGEQRVEEGTLREIIDHVRRIIFYWFLGWQCGELIEQQLNEKAHAAGISPQDLASYIPTPQTPLFAQQAEAAHLKGLLQEKGLWELLKDDPKKVIAAIQDSLELRTLFDEHLRRYSWLLSAHWTGEALTIEQLLDQMTTLGELDKKMPRQVPTAIAPYIDIAERVYYLREASGAYSSQYETLARPYLMLIAEHLGVSYREMLSIAPTEMFQNGALIQNATEIVRRRADGNWFVYSAPGDVIEVIDDPETVQSLSKRFVPAHSGNGEGVLQGTTGNKGVARGPVRMVMTNDDFHKMQPGDVLVTPMTTPDFVLLMQKASAIVTDMGGLLCHAAIVSRELGKPCVIDTKFATQMLKDGDMVEVDASAGVVRKISLPSTLLSKVFSRERPFFYFSMWNESDRIGMRRYAAHDLQNSLFLREGSSNKGSAWYSLVEFEEMKQGIAREISSNPGMVDEMVRVLDEEWAYLEPVLKKQVRIESIELFADYYQHLVAWWSAMCIFYFIPDISSIDQAIRDRALAYRAYVEQFSDEMHHVYTEFWSRAYPQYADITYVLLPDEAVALAKGEISKAAIAKIRTRLGGFALFNSAVYDLDQLPMALNQHQLELERATITGVESVTGSTAYPGVVRGKVRLVLLRETLPLVEEGDILITEMTDPDFVPAMKKAAAIVTDEGGIICHAAIVAREMQKPCVIGTKIATQVFKDGDMVEVDANEGIVRKLETSVLIEHAIPVYEKWAERDFCLPFVELWNRGETTEPRQWTSKQQPYQPYIVHICRDGLVTDYTDYRGIHWLKAEIMQLMEADPQFVLHATEEFYKRENKIRHVWQEQKILSRRELADYYAVMLDAWPWYEVIWWTMDFAEPESELFELVRDVRVTTEEMNPSTDILTRKSLRSIYPELGDEVDYMLIEEIANDTPPTRDQLQKRKKSYAYAHGRLFTGTDAREMEERFKIKIEEPEADLSMSQLAGDVACRGKVQGKVRIVMSRNDIPAVEQGEVLVCPMTMPDYIAGMNRAVAFVTDEGGIVSHAAIVAREMGKPCILNTKTATKFFKTGDMVEVDADNGIVRKL